MAAVNVIPHSSVMCGAIIAARVQLPVPVNLAVPLQVIGDFYPKERMPPLIVPAVSVVDAIDEESRPMKLRSYGPDVNVT